MVVIEPMIDEEPKSSPAAPSADDNGDAEMKDSTPPTAAAGAARTASEERLLDAEAIELAAASLGRPTARAHLEALAGKLRRDAAALGRAEESRAKAEAHSAADGGEEKKEGAAGEAAAARPAVPAAAAPAAEPAAPRAVPVSAKYSPIDRFSFDAGGYNSDRVTLYVPLPGVGAIPRDQITCDFTPTSFDLIVRGLGGKDHRLVNDNLEKDIDVNASKYIVKADKIIIKLGKCKGEYGSYDHWQNLTAKKAKKKASDGRSVKEDPSAGIMDLMKDMYDEGDDNMKRMIGETMWKQRTGQLGKDKDMDMGMGGMGGMDDDF